MSLRRAAARARLLPRLSLRARSSSFSRRVPSRPLPAAAAIAAGGDGDGRFSSSSSRGARPPLAAGGGDGRFLSTAASAAPHVDVRGRTGTLNDGILEIPTKAVRSPSRASSEPERRPEGADTVDAAAAAAAAAEGPRTSLLMELADADRVGILYDVLKYFWKHDVNITRIESRPANEDGRFDFFVDFRGSVGDDNVDKLLRTLRDGVASRLLVLDEKEVQWFPRHISELDLIADRVLDAGTDLESDHPGFNDPIYRARRAELAKAAREHKWDQPIGHIEYTKEETETWTAVWDRMEGLWEEYACKEYMDSLEQMKSHCGYSRSTIPQQSDVSRYLLRKSEFRMRPVPGLLSSRDFLNGLAFRVFFCTQYIRHHSRPLYTPEPDICHELLGHAPMFADRDFADFSQQIGLASLGASDDDVLKLARCYWHSVEFGLCREDGRNKAYGAGLLSSFGELEFACSDDHPSGEEEGCDPPKIVPWDPSDAAVTDFPVTTYQPTYFLAESLEDAKDRMRRYCEGLPRPFFARHDPTTDSVRIDRPVRRCVGVPGE